MPCGRFMKINNMHSLGISVIIPVFNGARYIERAINSVRKQCYKDVEILVIDGGSTDQTVEIASALLGVDDRLVSQRDEGQLDAVRKGVCLASKEISYWLNVDDFPAPGTFEAVASAFAADPVLEIIYSDDWVWHESSRKVFVGQTIAFTSVGDHLYKYRQVYSECFFWRTRLSSKIRFWDTSLRVATDYSITLQLELLSQGKRKWIRKRLGIFSVVESGQQLSQIHRSRVEEEKTKIKKQVHEHYSELLPVPPSHLGFWIRNSALPFLVRAVRVIGRLITHDKDRRELKAYIEKL